jgi:hypothetical protein
MKTNAFKSAVWENRTPAYVTTLNDQKKQQSLLSFARPSLLVKAAGRV